MGIGAINIFKVINFPLNKSNKDNVNYRI